MNRQALIAILIFLTIAFGFWTLQPKYQNLRLLQKEIGQKEKELEAREEYFAALQNISEKLKNYTTSLAKIDSALPGDSDLPSLFNFLKETGAQSGLIFKEIKDATVKTLEAPAVKETKINLSFSGSYPSFKTFVSEIEKSARLIELSLIEFSTPKEGAVFTFDIVIKVYSY